MKNENVKKLLARASRLAAGRWAYTKKLETIIKEGKRLEESVHKCAKQIDSRTLEDCLGLIPEAIRPKVINFTEGELSDSTLLQLNPLTNYAIWFYPARKFERECHGCFSFRLGEFSSRSFYTVRWYNYGEFGDNGHRSEESKKAIGSQLTELCRDHGITRILLETEEHGDCVWSERDYEIFQKNGPKPYLVELYLLGYFHPYIDYFAGIDPKLVAKSTAFLSKRMNLPLYGKIVCYPDQFAEARHRRLTAIENLDFVRLCYEHF